MSQLKTAPISHNDCLACRRKMLTYSRYAALFHLLAPCPPTRSGPFQAAHVRKVGFSLLTLVLLFLLPCLAAADVSVSLKLDRNKTMLTDSVSMVVKVSGSRSSGQPVIKGLEPFDVSSRGTSSRVEILNNKVNAGIEYSYLLMPKKAGTFRIGPAELKVKGTVVQSNTESLTIIEPARSAGEDRGPLFLSAGLSTHDVYVEEQVIYSLKLYRRSAVSNISLSLPEAEHLSFKQLGKPAEYPGVYNNKQYQVLEVHYLLVPSKEGEYGIRPARMNLTLVQSRRISPFDMLNDPFFSRSSGIPKSLASEPLELRVLPLPEKGRPADFSGLVGSFEMESRLEPSEIRAGESATLTVLLKGRGNVKRIPDLRMPELEKAKVYADQPVLSERLDTKGKAGSKIMKWAIVPEKEGPYQLPGLSVSFFDTAKHKYRTIRSRSHSLKVLPGREEQVKAPIGAAGEQDIEGPAKKEVKELGRDILPIHTSMKGLDSESLVRSGTLQFWLILIFPLLIYITTFWILRFSKRSANSKAAIRARKAAGRLVRQCRDGLSSNDMILCLRDYLKDRFGLSLGSLTAREAEETLLENKVSPETAKELHDLVRVLEDAVYTGRGDESCSVAEKIVELIRKVEREIR
ncbi:MAG: protein BatD [Deltaproteobacteria bacterium]|nr:protein BatD [Deltaproteobacteria bacterium]